MIQKRTMIFVSDQAFISKWWWIGAIGETRAPVLEADRLDDHRERLDDIDPGDQDEQRLGACDDREAGERAAERHRARVAHEELGRVGVVPEESDRSPDQRGRENREVELEVVALAGVARADVCDHGDRQEREERDDARPRREPVDAVGQIRAVCCTRDDEEQEGVVGVRELDVDVGDRNVDPGVELRLRVDREPTTTVIAASPRSFHRPWSPSERRWRSLMKSSRKPIAPQATVTKSTVSAGSVNFESARKGRSAQSRTSRPPSPVSPA